MSCWRHKFDPGPCPVDDMPHTTCTPENIGTARTLVSSTRLSQTVTATQPLPGFLRGRAVGVPILPNAQPVREEISTKTYRGRKRR
jgi:hypothetical protein